MRDHLCRHLIGTTMSDPDRLARKVLGHAASLVLYARQWLDRAAAEDVVQEALVSLLTQRTPPDDPVAWMFRAVRNEAIDSARSASRRKKREESVARTRQDLFHASSDSLMDARVAEGALKRLPIDLAEIVVLRIWSELGFAQIAGILKLSQSTVHDRYVAALAQLRGALEQSCKSRMD
jgi:RNA polymerase sigma-70 factor (ECF subfamily)